MNVMAEGVYDAGNSGYQVISRRERIKCGVDKWMDIVHLVGGLPEAKENSRAAI